MLSHIEGPAGSAGSEGSAGRSGRKDIDAALRCSDSLLQQRRKLPKTGLSRNTRRGLSLHFQPSALAVAMRFMRHESWDDALFVHYPVDAAMLQRRLPPGLVVDTHDGVAYVGVVLLTESGR